MNEKSFTSLKQFLTEIPAITGSISSGSENDGRWWVKFEIGITHQYAWHTVQELGYVLNYLSVEERLPTSFHPVSPPPYMSGGPADYLSWVIESHDPEFKPSACAECLESRLPDPVNDFKQWDIA